MILLIIYGASKQQRQQNSFHSLIADQILAIFFFFFPYGPILTTTNSYNVFIHINCISKGMNQAGHMVKVHDENIESILLYTRTHTQTQTIMIIVQFFLWMAMITNYCVVAVLLMVVFITFHHYNGWNWFFFGSLQFFSSIWY